jgi:hypothetical protein
MSDAESEAADVVSRLREEISLAESGLGGAMMGIADSYRELACGAGRGHGVAGSGEGVTEARRQCVRAGSRSVDLVHEVGDERQRARHRAVRCR